MLNAEQLKKDFPLFSRKINNQEIIYLDSACMTLKPQPVIDAITSYYTSFPACGGRSSHKLGTEVTEKMDEARKSIQKLINAKTSNQIVFTKNTTESINLVSRSLGFEKGDKVLTTDREHNSNLIPWLLQEKISGIKHETVISNEDNTFNLDNFKEKLEQENVKLVSMVHTSNLDGYTIPAKEVITAAHDKGALVLLDCAQSVPHSKIDVQKLGVDFIAFSGHKMMGPTGTGALYGKKELLDQLEPFILGGDTAEDTHYDSFKLEKVPHKFEAGLQNYAGIIGFGAAADYLMNIGPDKIHDHEVALNKIMTEELKNEPLDIIGPADAEQRGSVFDFVHKKVDAHTLSTFLDESANIMTRSGAHCVHSWFNAHNLQGATRASLYLYNTESDIQKFIETIKQAGQLF